MRLKIGCDIDEVLADWSTPFFKRFSPKKDSDITKICKQILAKDRNFWLNLPVLRRPIGFEPELYCTKRSCLKTYSKEWLTITIFHINLFIKCCFNGEIKQIMLEEDVIYL